MHAYLCVRLAVPLHLHVSRVQLPKARGKDPELATQSGPGPKTDHPQLNPNPKPHTLNPNL